MDEHVFILDDNTQIVEALTYAFDDAGIIVDSATSYTEAMDSALDTEYDCLFIDMRLENGNTGADFAYEYMTVYPKARIIIMTGHNSIEKLRTNFHFERVIKKPFNYPKMISIVKNPPIKQVIEVSGKLINLLEISIKQNGGAKKPSEETRKIQVYKEQNKMVNKFFVMAISIIILIAILYMIVR